MGDTKFVQALAASEYWQALEKSKVLALNGTGYCETPLLALGNDLCMTCLVPVSQEIENLSFDFLLVLLSQWYFLSVHNLSHELE